VWRLGEEWVRERRGGVREGGRKKGGTEGQKGGVTAGNFELMNFQTVDVNIK